MYYIDIYDIDNGNKQALPSTGRFRSVYQEEVNEFCGFLIQFSTNFHEILHTLFTDIFHSCRDCPESFAKF